MTTANPLDTIEVGKQYRFVPRPTPEFACVACGYIIGTGRDEEVGNVVRVIGRSTGVVVCPECSHGSGSPLGVYGTDMIVRNKSGNDYHVAAPYTWLQPLEEPTRRRKPSS